MIRQKMFQGSKMSVIVCNYTVNVCFVSFMWFLVVISLPHVVFGGLVVHLTDFVDSSVFNQMLA